MSAPGARSTARGRRRTALAALCVLLAATPALAAMPLRDPVEVRLEGYLDASEQQINPWAMLDVWLTHAPGRKFALTNLIVLSSSDVSSSDIVAAIQPLHPNLILNGAPSLLDSIATAQPNQYLQITGYTAFGPQRILVTHVDRSAPITGPTPTPSLTQKLFGF